ncbi:MAG: EamA family transporter [Pseudomonadota bacterium]
MASTVGKTEYLLLGLLAILWGSSYLFIKVAVAEIPPVTLIALRVLGAAAFLMVVMRIRSERLPTDMKTWRMLFVQALFNSIGAWTVLAWGQQFVDSGLASVLNSTAPLFVILITATVTRHEATGGLKLLGALTGLVGVILIVGPEVLNGLGAQVAGQLACLLGALLYAGAAIYGKRLAHVGALATATGTMIWASAVLVPLAVLLDRPWALLPTLSTQALAATATLSILCTGVALLIYFRLLNTIGSLGVASQAYLRAGVGVVLGLVVLGETISVTAAIGLAAVMAGVILINLRNKNRMSM